MISKKPLIGITLDYFDPKDDDRAIWYSQWHWYALRYRYCEAVAMAEGVPLALPYYLDCIDAYTDALDGLVLTGGGFDIDPKLYGDENCHPSVTTKPKRTEFEMAIAQRMLQLNKPVLGICGGMQLLNVLYHGTLYQDLPSENNSDINHSQTHDRHFPQHDVFVQPDTLLGRLLQKTSLSVNSVHHQAVKKLGNGFQINAKASDGIIEGIESADQVIFQGFIKACVSD